ncbi:hypothetical protein [Brevundimonas balnearis]|uniref:DUF2946 domain-containing protein n=1 Tax=Brevundimonas balnearis TaxID=1572858 RepID=A0ABV6QZA9_9CAUL
MTVPAKPVPILRALAFLAATFALVFGALLPSAVAASARHDRPIVLCSAEGPRTIQVGANGERRAEDLAALKCAACVMAAVAALPAPPPPQPAPPIRPRPATFAVLRRVDRLPPARAPPRPPSTAPPHA